jgi:hypothetical protein
MKVGHVVSELIPNYRECRSVTLQLLVAAHVEAETSRLNGRQPRVGHWVRL